MPCPWLQFTHSPCLSYSGSEGGKRKRERMFTMLWSCLLPSLSASAPASDQRQREREIEGERARDIGGGSTASFFPSLPPLPLFAPVFPSSPLAFIFLVFACPLKAKGLCALCVCVCMCGGVWVCVCVCVSARACVYCLQFTQQHTGRASKPCCFLL